MRIVYLAEYNTCRSSGVLKKVLGQTNTWRSLGHSVKLILVSPPCKNKKSVISESAEVFSSEFLLYTSGYLQTYLNKIVVRKNIQKNISQYKPDLIYYRDGLWYPGLLQILSMAPYVIEVNTIPDTEYFGFKKLLYLLSRRKLYTRAAGIVAVTEEIANRFREYNTQVHVSPNSFDIGRTTPRYPPSNEVPTLLFVGSPAQRWQGVDRLIGLARALPEFDFHIAGSEGWPNTPQNIYFHGYIDSKNLYNLYHRADVGIGTLALYRKKMSQATPLKIREYLAYGLPVIIAYDDMPLKGLDFVLRLPSEGDLARHAEEVRAFVLKWKGKEIPREVVASRINMLETEQNKLCFLQSLTGDDRESY